MKHRLPIFLIALFVLAACKKERNNSNICFPDAPTLRTLLNQQATVQQLTNGQFYLVERGSIDTRLDPCDLPAEYQVDNLSVTITGETRAIIQPPLTPCCSEGLIIFKISK